MVVRLVGVGEVPREELQDHLVDRVQEIDGATRERVADDRHGQAVLALANTRREDGPRGLERRVRIAKVEELVEDRDQPPEVGLAPRAAGALSLLDDHLDGRSGRREVGDGDEFREPEVTPDRLRRAGAKEQPLLAEPLHEPVEAQLDRPVQLADRRRSPAAAARSRPRSPGGRGAALSTAARASWSAMSRPSGRSRKMKCRRAVSLNGRSSIRIPAG